MEAARSSEMLVSNHYTTGFNDPENHEFYLKSRNIEGISKSFRIGRLERELQMVQLPLGAVVSLFCESV